MAGIAQGDNYFPLGAPFRKIYRGDQEVDRIYRGDSLVYQKTLGNTASDNFNRTNANGLGPNWSFYNVSNVNLSTSIVSNMARSNVQTDDGTFICRCRYDTTPALADDQYVQAKIGAANNVASDLFSHIGLRENSPAIGAVAWAVIIDLVNNTAKITSAINGTWTARTGTLSAVSVNDVFRLEARGRLFTAYRNGSSIGSWNDTGNLTAMGSDYLHGGLGTTSKRIFFSNSFSYSLEDWSFGDLAPL